MRQPSVLGIVSFKVFPAQMGGQKGVANFYQHLSSHTKVMLAVEKENTALGIDYTVLPFLYHHKWGFANLRYVYRLRKLIKEESIDVICIEHSYLGWLGLLLRWLTGKPLIIHSHNIEAHRFRDMHKALWRVYQWYEKWVHGKADHNFFISQEEMDWSIQHYHLLKEKCTVITYGTDVKLITDTEKKICRNQLITENKLDLSTRLFLFNGTLDYLPNTDALRIIISELLLLLNAKQFVFRIFICGNRLSDQWQKVIRSYPELIYKGFVEDISLYFKGADCFINPVTLGSGIKTKLIEALAYNQTCISVRSGAKGIPREMAGEKLVLVDDYDWQAFADNMFSQGSKTLQSVPSTFYQFFNWETITQKAVSVIETLKHRN
ncbi:MAG: glycosyltransferase family 4 protein [Sediminibacterium sp.]